MTGMNGGVVPKFNNIMNSDDNDDNDDSSSSSSSLGSAEMFLVGVEGMDLTGVNFDDTEHDNDHDGSDETDDEAEDWERLERKLTFHDVHGSMDGSREANNEREGVDDDDDDPFAVWRRRIGDADEPDRSVDADANVNLDFKLLEQMSAWMRQGDYVEILRCEAAQTFFQHFEVRKEATLPHAVQAAVEGFCSDSGSDNHQRRHRHGHCSRRRYRYRRFHRLVLEMIAIASLHVFYQWNYTGPVEDDDDEDETGANSSQGWSDVNPHGPLRRWFFDDSNQVDQQQQEQQRQQEHGADNEMIRGDRRRFHQNILSCLAMDGAYPASVVRGPYFLWLGRALLRCLSTTTHTGEVVNKSPWLWWTETEARKEEVLPDAPASSSSSSLSWTLFLWNARAAVAHHRLLDDAVNRQGRLWKETERSYRECLRLVGAYDDRDETGVVVEKRKRNVLVAGLWLEYGLAQHHFDVEETVDDKGDGKNNNNNNNDDDDRVRIMQRACQRSFRRAQESSGLRIEVTGAMGKRTKFQQDALAQMTVKAHNPWYSYSSFTTTGGKVPKQSSSSSVVVVDDEDEDEKENPAAIDGTSPLEVPFSEDEIRLDAVRYQDPKIDVDQGTSLDPLDRCVLLALCLQVKSTNPCVEEDALTSEEMGGYLERVIRCHSSSSSSSTGKGRKDQQQEQQQEQQQQHEHDWTVYSTALLERAWLECHRVHGRERGLLQIQALVDQHRRRLTWTQSTLESIGVTHNSNSNSDSNSNGNSDSNSEKNQNNSSPQFAPVQDRLRRLHWIVYPPRWELLRDLADRYAAAGIVTTAAGLYLEIERYGDAVDCYQRAGRSGEAQKVIRQRLFGDGSGSGTGTIKPRETPRLWVALGRVLTSTPCVPEENDEDDDDDDDNNKNDKDNFDKDKDVYDPVECYQRAVELSRGRYAPAHFALAAHWMSVSNDELAAKALRAGLAVRWSSSHWFTLGTLAMRLCVSATATEANANVSGSTSSSTSTYEYEEEALQSFAEIVRVEPPDHCGDAWANVAAIHMRRRESHKAHPALVEALKVHHLRHNGWKVWTNYLYVCLDLERYDEAVRACKALLDIRRRKNGTGTSAGSGTGNQEVVRIEEKCVRAIVGGVLRQYQQVTTTTTTATTGTGTTTPLSSEAAARMESAERTLERTADLLTELSEVLSTSSTEAAWIWQCRAHFDRCRVPHRAPSHTNESTDTDKSTDTDTDATVLAHLMKEYRSLTTGTWATDPDRVDRVGRVVLEVCDLHQRACGREASTSRKKAVLQCRLLLTPVLRSIRAAHEVGSLGTTTTTTTTTTTLPPVVQELERALNDLDHSPSRAGE